jgi:hypothetical protein
VLPDPLMLAATGFHIHSMNPIAPPCEPAAPGSALGMEETADFELCSNAAAELPLFLRPALRLKAAAEVLQLPIRTSSAGS